MWVDSQCHVSPIWYEPVESLLDQMQRSGVAQAVLIQMLGQTDNRYQQECIARFPGRFASVVLVDAASDRACSQLNKLADEGASGVRLRPTARSPGPDALAIWRCAQDRSLAVSCVGNSATFSAPEFESLIAELPKLTVVLEHLGGSNQPDLDDAARAQRSRVMTLAKYANVYMKVPGLGELAARRTPPTEDGPFESHSPEVLKEALGAFGAPRLMWGSDYPPVSAREGYANAFALCMIALDKLPAADLGEIFGGVARRIFKLPPASGQFRSLLPD